MMTALQLVLAKLAQFREIVLLDFEFKALPGERAEPICLVAKERTCASGLPRQFWQ